MDLSGHKIITDTFRNQQIGADVIPYPEDGENVNFVTIYTPELVAPATVLNILSQAGLLERPGTERSRKTPVLKLLGIQNESATFEDMNKPVRSGY